MYRCFVHLKLLQNKKVYFKMPSSTLPNGASLVAQLVKNPPVIQEIPVQFLGQEDPLEKGQATHSSTVVFPGGSAGKEFATVWESQVQPWVGRSPGEGNGHPLQYSGLENSMDCIVHGVAKSQTQLSDFHLQTLPNIPSEQQHPEWRKLLD